MTVNATTLRNALLALLLLGGIARLASAAVPERAPLPAAPVASGVCHLGTSCG